MTDRELMQQALDALDSDNPDIQLRAATALRARLAQPEPDDGYCQACDGNHCTAKNGCIALDNPRAQPEPEELGEVIPADEEQLKRIAKLVEPEPEPVAWKRPVYMVEDGWDEFGFTDSSGDDVPLYAAPPQREWQGLTDEELREVVGMPSSYSDWNPVVVYKWLHAIEAKLKEKNGF